MQNGEDTEELFTVETERVSKEEHAPDEIEIEVEQKVTKKKGTAEVEADLKNTNNAGHDGNKQSQVDARLNGNDVKQDIRPQHGKGKESGQVNPQETFKTYKDGKSFSSDGINPKNGEAENGVKSTAETNSNKKGTSKNSTNLADESIVEKHGVKPSYVAESDDKDTDESSVKNGTDQDMSPEFEAKSGDKENTGNPDEEEPANTELKNPENGEDEDENNVDNLGDQDETQQSAEDVVDKGEAERAEPEDAINDSTAEEQYEKAEPDTSAEDLNEQERRAAEDRAVELNPHGTGVDPDIPQEYDYEASPEATDVDYQPGDNGLSNEFTDSGGSDAYTNQFGNQADEDEVEDDRTEEQKKDEDGIQEQNIREEETYDGKEADQQSGSEKNVQQTNVENKNPARNNISWKKGDEITLELLAKVWPLAWTCKPVVPMLNTLNSLFKKTLYAIPAYGPSVCRIVDAYGAAKFVVGYEFDFIGDCLAIVTNPMKQTLMTAVGVASAVGTLDWISAGAVTLLGGLMKSVISISAVNIILQDIFSILIPFINTGKY